jgi:hypothetical protein
MLIHIGCGGRWRSHRIGSGDYGVRIRELLCTICGTTVSFGEHPEVMISDRKFIHDGRYCLGYRRGILMLSMKKGKMICTNRQCLPIPLTEFPGVEIQWQPTPEQLPLQLVLS